MAREPFESPCGIAAVASLSLKAVNEDAAVVVHNPAVPMLGVIVADGLGSHYGSELASASCCASVAQSLTALTAAERLELPEHFAAARNALEHELIRDRIEPLPDGVALEAAFGTTLLCGILANDTWSVAYVGNGAILHLRGDFADFPASQVLPWTSMNYLNPHSRWSAGTNALYKWMSPLAPPHQATPTALSFSADSGHFGDILVVCSDGICSNDQTPVGLDAEKHAWIGADESVRHLHRVLADLLAGSNPTAGALQVALQGYLIGLRDADLVSDDCTIGVVISEAALRYHASRAQRSLVAS